MEDHKRPLLVATGIAVVVLALLAILRVDMYRCTITHDAKGERSTRRGPEGGALSRDLRLWLDAAGLGEALRSALQAELEARGAGVELHATHADGGHVTVRLDDASLYTPLYARANVTAVMDFETRAHGDDDARAKGESRVAVTGACYGIVSPSTFERRLVQGLAQPLAEQLGRAFE